MNRRTFNDHMVLADAFQDLTTQLDVLCVTTQSRLFTRLAKQLTRLVQCEDRVRYAVLASRQQTTDHHRQCEKLTHELEELTDTHKKLVIRTQRDKQDRSDEREWLAALWPDEAVLPTLLKPYEPEPTPTSIVSHVEHHDERRRLEALVNRRAARERVRQQIGVARQWRMIVVPPSTSPEGEYVGTQTYYQNDVTGESVWDAPVAMFYEPPSHWDHRTMDWKESYDLDNFYTREETGNVDVQPVDMPTAIAPKTTDDSDDDEDDNEEEDHPIEFHAVSTSRTKPTARTDRSGDDDEDPPDPVTLRRELEHAFARAQELQAQLTTSVAEQRSLSLQLLNATRESFEREKEILATEDAAVKVAERQRRKAEKDEAMAAKAAAEARERKAMDKTVQSKFPRDSVAKKDLTLAKDDERLENELNAFAIEQRRNRLYLAAPLSADERVQRRHQWDDEYVHMKYMEQQQLAVEQTEFDLLEKTAHRLEEATKRCAELTTLLENAQTTQQEVEAELAQLPSRIVALEEPLAPPTEPRPEDDILARAKERYLIPDDVEAEEAADDVVAQDDPTQTQAVEKDKENEEDEDEQEEEDEVPLPHAEKKASVDPETMARDETELGALQHAINLDKQWRQWEENEVLRLEDLAAAYVQFQLLESMKRRLVVDIALYTSDLAFFEKLAEREKQLNEMLWSIQASAQTERARFLIERAAREESLFQVQDEYEAVTLRLDDARRLPRQAQNPLEQLELLEESKRQAEELQCELTALRARWDKELQAKALLLTLETRFHEYSQTRLEEEATLFAEKQALWDVNSPLHDELCSARDAIDALYAVLEGTPDGSTVTEADARVRYDDVSAMFSEKLQRLEAARQFLLLCYERESRWRALAAVALVKDTTSNEWMTSMQRERQEESLASLERQHTVDLRGLRREIKLLTKVKLHLQEEIVERDVKIDTLRSEYQRSSDAVRLETEQIILGLKTHLADEQSERAAERARALEERARLLRDHDERTTKLQERIAESERELEQQHHWLTAARRELHAQRIANDALLIGYQSLEQRRATEINDLRFRVAAQITRINNIEMWNLSLRIQAREAHAERIAMQQEIARLVEHHRQQQRLLRLEIWKHVVTAQAILTDVDTLFGFFADGLAIVAGATAATNDALRWNGGIELLAVLAKHNHQDPIKAIAATALGQISWNANRTARYLGFQAKKCWFTYKQRLATRVMHALEHQKLVFDSVASENSPEMNWFDDPHEKNKLRFLETWNARDAIAHPDVNNANHEYVALAPGVLMTIIDLCRHQDLGIQRNSLRSLALVVRTARNTAIVGRLDGCIPLLVELMTTAEDPTVLCHAIEAVANLAFENEANQNHLCEVGAVPKLLGLAARHDDVDILRASVDALAHLSYLHRSTCEILVHHNGLGVLTQLCGSSRLYDAIDLERYEAIQTSAAETIANVICELDEPPPAIVDGVATFVLMCASCTRDVAFHGTRVLGCLAQHDMVRAAIGTHGGIDALFVVAGKHHDAVLVTQATWALANATWHRENQYRVARYLDHLFTLATFAETNNQHDEADTHDVAVIREHALCVVANALFYNDANRMLVAAHTSWMTLVAHTCRSGSGASLEHAARALCALSYSDAVALALGGSPGSDILAPARAVEGLALLVKLCGSGDNVVVQQHGLFGLINMCLHDVNKAKLLAIPHAIETLVNLSGATNPALCDPAIEALDLLADVRQSQQSLVGSHPAAVLSPSTMSSLAASDLKKLVGMLQDTTASPALVAMATDAIADEVWKKPSAKVRLRNEHGLDTLLELCVSSTSVVQGHERVLLSCLWALRHSVADNARNQDYVGALNGIPRLVGLYDRYRQREDVIEAVLAVLIALVLTHPRNSQDLVQHGVDMLVVLADGMATQHDDDEDETRHEPGKSPQCPPSQGNRALAKELLLLLAPYSSTTTTPASPPVVSNPRASPEKQRVNTKKPVHLPQLTSQSPLAAAVSPTKHHQSSNN